MRGKARTRLRYNQWVNSMDNWLSDDVPKLADYDKRQFPEQNMRWGAVRCGLSYGIHEVVGRDVRAPQNYYFVYVFFNVEKLTTTAVFLSV